MIQKTSLKKGTPSRPPRHSFVLPSAPCTKIWNALQPMWQQDSKTIVRISTFYIAPKRVLVSTPWKNTWNNRSQASVFFAYLVCTLCGLPNPFAWTFVVIPFRLAGLTEQNQVTQISIWLHSQTSCPPKILWRKRQWGRVSQRFFWGFNIFVQITTVWWHFKMFFKRPK